MKPLFKICLIITAATLWLNAVAQDNLVWQLTYFSTPSQPLVVPDGVAVDCAGNAYIAYRANDNVHLAKVTRQREVVFDDLIALSSYSAGFPQVFYTVSGIKESAGTATAAPRSTVFAFQTVYPVNAPEVDSIWMNQFDQKGNALWTKPVLITSTPIPKGYPYISLVCSPQPARPI